MLSNRKVLRGFTPLQIKPKIEKLKFLTGFTLIELMVVVAIFTIVIGAAYVILDSSKVTWHVGETKIELQEDLRLAIDDMVFEIFEADPAGVVIAGGGSSITLQTPVDENASGSWEDTTLDGTADFYLEHTLDVSNDIVWGAYLRREDRSVDSVSLGFGNREGRQLSFLLSGNDLVRRVTSAGAVLEDFIMADDINALNFNMDINGNISVTVNAQKISLSRQPVVYVVTTAISPRN